MNRRFCSGARYAVIVAMSLGIAGAFPVLLEAGEVVECSLLYETPDGFFVDAGSERGLESGARGSVQREGRRIATVEVVRSSRSTSLVRVLSGSLETSPRPGDEVHLNPPGGAADDEITADDPRSWTLKPPGQPDDEFVPLLAPPRSVQRAVVESRNVFHGRTWFRQLLQADPETLRDYSVSRLGSRGSLDRIQGTPWALEWHGDLSYRDGHALEATRDYQKPRLRVYRLSLFRRFGDRSLLRVGRFLPRALPSVGYVDGVQGEKALGDHLRLGAVTGLKPTRALLDLSFREPLAVPYLTLEVGDAADLYYSGTAGVLGSLYEGEPDRVAFLLEQVASLGRWLSLHSTSEVDMDVGGAETRSGARLTHLDLFAAWRATSFLELRAGVDHHERPDTQAERSVLDFEDDGFFDDGYWRYWAGASQSLPWRLRLSEEIALIDPDASDDLEPRWQLRATRTGLPLLPTSSISLAVYNFEGIDVDGLGGRLSSHLALLEDTVYLDPAVTFRMLEIEGGSEDFSMTDVSLYATWMISQSWSAHAGVSYAFGTDVDRMFIDLGVDLRW